jgi:hypothetical protein
MLRRHPHRRVLSVHSHASPIFCVSVGKRGTWWLTQIVLDRWERSATEERDRLSGGEGGTDGEDEEIMESLQLTQQEARDNQLCTELVS